MALTATSILTRARRWNRWRIVGWSLAACLLLTPLAAMQVSDQVVWQTNDFVIFGILLAGVGAAGEILARRTVNRSYRAGGVVALAAAFMSIWINGAVGVIGTAQDPANLMFAGVLAVGFTGSIIARFRPGGMARTMLITALAQVIVGGIAIVVGLKFAVRDWPRDIVLFTVFFTALWVLSSWLFRKSVA